MTTTASLDAESAPRAGAVLSGAAFACLALLPLAMVPANRSAPAIVAGAAVLAMAGAHRDGRGSASLTALRGLAGAPLGRIALIFAGLALASLMWSGHRPATLFALGEAGIPAVAALVLAVSLPRDVPHWPLTLAAAAFALACGMILAELWTGMAWRQAAGLRAFGFVFNRPVITLVLVYWPLALLLVAAGRRVPAALLGVLLAVTVFRAHSGAAMLGLGLAAIFAGATWLASRAASAALLAALLAAMVVAPIKGDIAAAVLPQRAVAALQSVHARDRIDIWQSFGAVVRRRPILGTGFGTSGVLASDAVVAEVEADRRTLLDVGHPHDAFLQIWSELGLIGAGLAAAGLVALMYRVRRLPQPRLVAANASIAAMFGIALVGHGAWQGWWIAVIGATILWSRFMWSRFTCTPAPATNGSPS